MADVPNGVGAVGWKEYVDTLRADMLKQLDTMAQVNITAVENVRREADIMGDRNVDTIERFRQAVDVLEVSVGRRFDQVNHQISDLNMLKTDTALQAADVQGLRREMTILRELGDLAIGKAEAAVQRKLESMNEFRDQLRDQALTFMPREVAEAAFTDVRSRIAANTTRIDQSAGKAAGSATTIGYFIAAATIILSVIVVLSNTILQ